MEVARMSQVGFSFILDVDYSGTPEMLIQLCHEMLALAQLYPGEQMEIQLWLRNIIP